MRLASRLALKGASVYGSRAPRVVALWRPYCDDPVPVVMRSHPRSSLPTVSAELLGPCRKCPKCRLFRRMRWRQRVYNEIAQCDDSGRRSWFCTLTFADLHLAGIQQEGHLRASSRGVPLPEAIEWSAYRHVQRFHKRLRKRLERTGRNYRYCMVPEYGETFGRLHYHMIVHETAAPILYRDFQASWYAGFMQSKLVDCTSNRGMAGAASYISKYIAKDLSHRVRASGEYGQVP